MAKAFAPACKVPVAKLALEFFCDTVFYLHYFLQYFILCAFYFGETGKKYKVYYIRVECRSASLDKLLNGYFLCVISYTQRRSFLEPCWLLDLSVHASWIWCVMGQCMCTSWPGRFSSWNGPSHCGLPQPFGLPASWAARNRGPDANPTISFF
jgi:hypothetical protein